MYGEDTAQVVLTVPDLSLMPLTTVVQDGISEGSQQKGCEASVVQYLLLRHRQEI